MADLTVPAPTANRSTTGGDNVRSITRGVDNANKYVMSEFAYPSDLFANAPGSGTGDSNTYKSNQAYNSYVVFYINVTEESRVVKKNESIVVGTVDRSEQNTLQNGGTFDEGRFASVATEAGAITGGVIAAAAGAGNALSSLFKPGGIKKRLGEASGQLALAAGQGAVAGAATGFIQTGVAVEALGLIGIKSSGSIKRLKTAIAMHVPQNYVVGYRVNYADEELGAMFGTAAAAARGAGVDGGDAAILGLASRADSLPAISALTRATINPRREQLFRNVDNRRFTFEYQFAPRSPAEAKNIRRIINTFKYHMHPEYIGDNRLAYLAPSEFDIVHMFKSAESENINKISTCVLAEMTVNYSPNGQFSVHDDGMPPQINVQMTFIELETLTKDRIIAKESELGSVGGRDGNFAVGGTLDQAAF